MYPLRMIHEQHGATHVYHEAEQKYHEALGWKPEEAQPVQQEQPAVVAPRKPGRPRKAA